MKVTAKILLHGAHIADLSSDGKISSFMLLDSYKDNPNRDTLSLSIFSMSPERLTVFESLNAPLPAFIKILLPEGAIREQLIEDSEMAINEDSFEADVYLLDLCGSDLTGAISVIDVEHEGVFDDFREKIVKAIVPEKARTLSGAQAKLSVNKRKGRLTLPYKNETGSFIAKPQPEGKHPHIALNEYLHMKLAKKMGLNVPGVELIHAKIGKDAKERSYYVVERFDRTQDGQKIHMEELHQILSFGLTIDSNSKYDDYSYSEVISFLSSVDKKLKTNITVEYLKELAYSALIGNADFHLKNSALLYLDGRTPSKAPSYDLLCTEYHGFRSIAVRLYDDVKISVNDFDESVYYQVLDKAGLKEGKYLDIFNSFQDKIFDEFQNLIAEDEILQKGSNRGFVDSIDYRLKNLCLAGQPSPR